MYRFGFLLLIAGGMMIYFSFLDRSLDEKASATPEPIALAKLIERGPEGNPHVEVKEFALGENFVTEVEGGNQDHFQRVWLPVIPLQPGQPRGNFVPAGGGIQAILKSSALKNEAAVNQLAGTTSIKGMVINTIEKLSGEERNLLAQKYPGTDFDRCLIIQHNRTPQSAAFRMWLLAGGVVVLVCGCLFFIMAYAKHKSVYN